MASSTGTKILWSLLGLVMGMILGYSVGGIKEKANVTSFNEQAKTVSLDSLREIQDTVNSIVARKDQSRLTSLKAVGVARDSLLEVKGQLTGAMIGAIKQPTLYDSLAALRENIAQLVSACDEVIKAGTLNLLQPTNKSLKTLIRDIKQKTTDLQKIAQTVATVSDIVTAITTILTAPIFGPVSAAVAT